MIEIQRKGYRSEDITTDITLGLTDGLDTALWCYIYAAIIFTGTLSVFLSVGVLIALLGWIVVALMVTLLSKEPVHVANKDDQAVVLIGSISALLVASMGDMAATPQGLATILAIMALISLLFSASCYLVGKYRLTRVFDLLPFPIIAGFMAGIGWMLLNAGVEISTGVYITSSFLSDIEAGNSLLKLVLFAFCGLAVMISLEKFDKSWLLPALFLLIVAAYYLGVTGMGMSHEEQVSGGWLFEVEDSGYSIGGQISALSLSHINWQFILSVAPQILTITFIATFYASMTVASLKANSEENIVAANEFKMLGIANLSCAAICSPPGFTDSVSTSAYRSFGATSRWMQLTAVGVGIAVIVFGGHIINYMPTLLVGAIIFLIAFQILFDWLVKNTQAYSKADWTIALTVFVTIILSGFMQGISAGAVLVLIIYLFNYKHIHPVVTDSSRKEAGKLKANVVLYKLRGFLFFGSAGSVYSAIMENEDMAKGKCSALLVDLEKVTGLDASALKVFSHIASTCEERGIKLLISGASPHIEKKLSTLKKEMNYFDGVDMALEYFQE